MADITIPEPVSGFIASVNAGDEAAVFDAFTDSAFVDDWGRVFGDRAAIKKWSDVEFIGSKGVLTPEEVTVDGATVTVIGDWRSNHANGRSSFAFVTEGQQIASMTIRGAE